MDGAGHHLSMMRTLLLLNTTQRKLQQEENIYDSSAPLKALQLARVAYMLNDHLHHEQSMQTKTTYDRHMDFRPIQTTIEEEEIEEDPADELVDDDDAILSEMYSAIEVSQVSDEDFNSTIEVEEVEVLEDSTAVLSVPIQHNHIYDEDLLELDLTEMDLDDMPTLSRHSSYTSLPSLYHSDGESDDEDHSDVVAHREDALSRFLSTDHRSISHPASQLFDKPHQLDTSNLTPALNLSIQA